MAKRILVIDDSSLIRDFLTKQLTGYGFEVISGINGLDGFGKLRSEYPDLVIMDFYLSRKSSMDILKYKASSPPHKDIPVLLISNRLDRETVMQVGKLNVRKILFKPLKIDALLDAVSEALSVNIELDQAPCILDAHLNDKILFIEIAKGFNKEKFSLLRYKIAELLHLYHVEIPRILLLMTDIHPESSEHWKLKDLLLDILEFCQSPRQIKILTVSGAIKEFIEEETDLSGVETVSTLEQAMDGLLGIKGLEKLTAEQDNVQQTFFSAQQNMDEEAFQLNFAKEAEEGRKQMLFQKPLNIAVVDDDFIVHSIVESALGDTRWSVRTFGDGAEFLAALNKEEAFDLVFLDLVMPGMNGFAVLQFLSTYPKVIPVIVLTALSRRESVQKAMQFNVGSYLVKPIKPDGIIKKALELLNTDF